MTIEFIDLGAQQARIKTKIDSRIQAVLTHGNYIMGPEVCELEAGLAAFCGAKHALGCANGTDALQLALMALNVGPGDAVFCPTFTFASTAEVVPPMGAIPIMVDVHEDSFNLDVASLKRAIVHARALGLRPAGVIPVDLFGHPADYDAIEAIAAEEGLVVLGWRELPIDSSSLGKTALGVTSDAQRVRKPRIPEVCIDQQYPLPRTCPRLGESQCQGRAAR